MTKKFKSYYQRTGIQTHKVITCTLTDKELEAQLFEKCRAMTFNKEANRLTEYSWLSINPQDIIRTALKNIGAFTGDSDKMFGDKSWWEPGTAIKTSFYVEDADSVRLFAAEQGMKPKELIQEALTDYFIEHGYKNKARIEAEAHIQQLAHE